jgi:L-threonylcarbamoyladenylate synthase
MSNLSVSIATAVAALSNGGIVALPTEGVYGLSCDPRHLSSIRYLCNIKQRPEDKGFVVVAATLEQLQDYIQPLSPEHLALVKSTWPGPVTWIVPVKAGVSPLIHGNTDTIAVRVTAHPILSAICQQLGAPIISTSANKSNESPATAAEEIDQLFSINQIDYILDGPLGNLNGPTEIRDLFSHAIIRPVS